MHAGILMMALAQRPHLFALESSRGTTTCAFVEPAGAQSKVPPLAAPAAAKPAAPRIRTGVIGSTITAEVKVMADTQDLLSAWAGETHGWTWFSNKIQGAGASIPGACRIRDAQTGRYR